MVFQSSTLDEFIHQASAQALPPLWEAFSMPALMAPIGLNSRPLCRGHPVLPHSCCSYQSTQMQLQFPRELLQFLMPGPHPRTIKSESPGIATFLSSTYSTVQVENHQRTWLNICPPTRLAAPWGHPLSYNPSPHTSHNNVWGMRFLQLLTCSSQLPFSLSLTRGNLLNTRNH